MTVGKTCFYCKIKYTTKDNEHVFPDGLGGERIMMDCVCQDCNREFSTLENELISKSFIAFMRVAEGVKDVPSGKQHVMKEVRTYRMDQDLAVALEVQVSNALKEKLFAQIILKEEKLHIRYEVEEEYNRLLVKLGKWKEFNKSYTLKSEHGEILSYEVSKDEKTKQVITTVIPEIPNGYIGLEIAEYKERMNEFLLPRIFEDSKGRLKIRARSQSEAIELIRHLLWWDLKTPEVVVTMEKGQAEIVVHHTHDAVMFNQALAKIALNCLIAYYPEVKNEQDKFTTAISFIKERLGTIPFQTTHQKNGLDLVDKTHNLFFFNQNTETLIRISLYNGAFQIVFFLPRLNAIDVQGPGRLLIDFQHKKNTFQDSHNLIADLERLA